MKDLSSIDGFNDYPGGPSSPLGDLFLAATLVGQCRQLSFCGDEERREILGHILVTLTRLCHERPVNVLSMSPSEMCPELLDQFEAKAIVVTEKSATLQEDAARIAEKVSLMAENGSSRNTRHWLQFALTTAAWSFNWLLIAADIPIESVIDEAEEIIARRKKLPL